MVESNIVLLYIRSRVWGIIYTDPTEAFLVADGSERSY
jgi:hypothetical protein